MPDDPFPFPFEIYPGNWFARLAPEDLFPDTGPIEIDLGCGDGSFLVRMAERYPERRFLGVERLLGRVRKVSRKVQRAGLANVRVIRIDTNYAVRHLLPLGAVHRIHFLCPDPWPKKKHAARRQMCQLSFLHALHDLLVADGELLFKTDSPAYHEEAIEVQRECPLFREDSWSDDAFFYPRTDFEEQWLAEGRTMHRLRLVRV